MMTAPHMAAGAAIGSVSRRWWLVLPIALAGHYVLDYVPHVESVIFYEGRPMWAAVMVGALSAALGVILMIWAGYRRPNRRIIYAATLVAILPDLVEKVFGDARVASWPPTAGIYSFHHTFHHSIVHGDRPLGIATQIAVIALAIWIVRRSRRAAR